MTLQTLRARHLVGDLDKAAYVAAMHGLHLQLLDHASLLHDSKVSRIEISDGQVVFTCRPSGLKLRYADPLDQYGCLTLLNFGDYEIEETALLFKFTGILMGERPFTFLDIGANMGWYALNMALAFPAATVHAFEPLPATFECLEKNLAVNGFSNVHLHNLGFMDKPGPQTFYCDPRISGRASARNLVADPEALPVSCPVVRLDDFVRDLDLAPAVMKVDVEGAEWMVFQGGLETIGRHQPLIMAEMLRKWALRFDYHPDAIIRLLAGLDYRCYLVAGGQLVELETMTESVTATNFFFLHRDRHAALLGS
jgi:FkbM family methyltransferase